VQSLVTTAVVQDLSGLESYLPQTACQETDAALGEVIAVLARNRQPAVQRLLVSMSVRVELGLAGHLSTGAPFPGC
jgi:hypothetical protein